MFRIAPAVRPNSEAKVAATAPLLRTSLVGERRELPAPGKRITDEQIASAIRYLDPNPGGERSGEDGTTQVICFSLLILLVGALALLWLFLQTSG